MTVEASQSISRKEYELLVSSIEEHKDLLTPETYKTFKKFFQVYTFLIDNFDKSRSLLKNLREAMRINPKSETGASALGKILGWSRIK